MDTVVSFLLPDAEVFKGSANRVIANFCHHVFFLASPEVGKTWAARHEDSFILSLDQAFELGRRKNAAQFRDVLVGKASAGS